MSERVNVRIDSLIDGLMRECRKHGTVGHNSPEAREANIWRANLENAIRAEIERLKAELANAEMDRDQAEDDAGITDLRADIHALRAEIARLKEAKSAESR